MNKVTSPGALLLMLIVLLPMTQAKAAMPMPSERLQGYNWYSERKEALIKKLPKELKAETINKSAETLPEYEKNIRSLQARHEKAHRQALDNPTSENILAELRLEKEMMRKSEIYGERRVAIAILDSKFSDMQHHSNVLHRSVQDEVDSKDTTACKAAKIG